MGKKRSLPLCILFSVITCGIYYLYWMAKVTTETNANSKYKTANGLLAIVYTILTGSLYQVYWAYFLCKRVGEMDGESGVLDPLFFQIPGVNVVLAQAAINRKVG